MSARRETIRAVVAIGIALLIFLFNWGAANLSWYGQWLRSPHP